jgi:HPr kinase/phosphorylase
LVIVGPSGSGKSGLAAQMIALGAHLVADDLTLLEARDEMIIASAPPTGERRIELRGFGLCSVPVVAEAPIMAVLSLGPARGRLPSKEEAMILGRAVPLLRHVPDAALAAKAVLWMHDGRRPA